LSASLQDAEPWPWKAERKPDPSPAELRLGRAALDFASAKNALEAHVLAQGARGPDHARLLAAHEAAWTALLSTAWGFPAEPRSIEGQQ